MKSLFIFAVACIFFVPVGAAKAAEATGNVAIFASEKLFGKRVESFFNSISSDSLKTNECETAAGEKLGEKGFKVVDGPFGPKQIQDARGLKTLIGRYSNISSMPDDTAIKAARVMGDDVLAVIACGVSAAKKGRGLGRLVCAEAGCKAIDMKSRRRVAWSAGKNCATGNDRTTAGLLAIREACGYVGNELANKLSGIY